MQPVSFHRGEGDNPPFPRSRASIISTSLRNQSTRGRLNRTSPPRVVHSVARWRLRCRPTVSRADKNERSRVDVTERSETVPSFDAATSGVAPTSADWRCHAICRPTDGGGRIIAVTPICKTSDVCRPPAELSSVFIGSRVQCVRPRARACVNDNTPGFGEASSYSGAHALWWLLDAPHPPLACIVRPLVIGTYHPTDLIRRGSGLLFRITPFPPALWASPGSNLCRPPCPLCTPCLFSGTGRQRSHRACNGA
jgi:hypothetical protein